MEMEYSTVTKCTPEQIWAVFSDTEKWSQWTPMIGGANWIEGEPWQNGSQLSIEAVQPSMKVKAKVVDPIPPNGVKWQGGMMGVNFESRFYFTRQPDGTTVMKSSLSLSGPAVFFMSNNMKNKGLAVFTTWFNALKAEAEKRAQ